MSDKKFLKKYLDSLMAKRSEMLGDVDKIEWRITHVEEMMRDYEAEVSDHDDPLPIPAKRQQTPPMFPIQELRSALCVFMKDRMEGENRCGTPEEMVPVFRGECPETHGYNDEQVRRVVARGMRSLYRNPPSHMGVNRKTTGRTHSYWIERIAPEASERDEDGFLDPDKVLGRGEA